ncbi:MAG: endonuclease [Thermoprotei archaeon]|nr:MAG: endonuclease [Thermoprotei archaeon]
MTSRTRYKVVFDAEKCRGIVAEKLQINDLEKKWFGTKEGDKLILDTVEIAYLLLNEKASVESCNTIITDFEKFISIHHKCLEEFFWPRLIVYKDLRDRGRRVRVLESDKFLVRDKQGNLRLVVVLEEGSLRSMQSIRQHVEMAMNNNLKLVYAIVSLQGDLTYYEVSRIDIWGESP